MQMNKRSRHQPQKTKPINKKYKHQYTKPYKDRDRSKDIGKDLPLKKSNRLHFPESPQYYIIPTAKKLTKDNYYFNILNRDQFAVNQKLKADKEAQQIQQKARQKDCQISVGTSSKQYNHKDSSLHPSENQNQSYDLSEFCKKYKASQQNSAIIKQKYPSQQMRCADASSLGIVSISQASQSPFNKGYSVTSGPKKYNTIRHSDDIRSQNASFNLSANSLSYPLNKSDKNISLNDINQSSSVGVRSQGPSI